MIDHSNASLEAVSVHHVGNNTNEGTLDLSEAPLNLDDPRLRELLERYFLPHFSEAEMYSFSFTDNRFELNPMYNYALDVFTGENDFHETSVTIARHLFGVAVHPQIKPGDLFVVRISNMNVDGQETDAIGVFKSETRQPFMQVMERSFEMRYDDGINVDKIDKACLIFNFAKEDGLRVCAIDKSKNNGDAIYWKDGFLNVKPCSDAFHNTQQFLSIAKKFVTDQVKEEFEMTRTDQIDLLNRSIDYFKNHSEFDKAEFEEAVFHHEDLINSFRNFDDKFRKENEMEMEDSFSISSTAVKKQARAFKSVLKLDNNFHVYIHGDKTMIERGIDPDGRKYYKIFYENEQ
ncbi:MAG: nucleoid-associated protein [Chitinophagaceae bacterium]|nr:MAG: nucleoid-associated protein [Chitinophagaceae bacterium]